MVKGTIDVVKAFGLLTLNTRVRVPTWMQCVESILVFSCRDKSGHTHAQTQTHIDTNTDTWTHTHARTHTLYAVSCGNKQ